MNTQRLYLTEAHLMPSPTDTGAGAAPPASRDEVEQVMKGLEAIQRLVAENDQLRIERDHFKRGYEINQNELDVMRHQLRQERQRGDHYFRLYTSLKSGLHTCATTFLEIIRKNEVDSYGEKGYSDKKTAGGGGPDTVKAPSFLQRPNGVRPSEIGLTP
jgi:regulator of replication initiation timing